jgi:hypothetical protein
MVREAVRNAVPPQRKKTERPAVKTYVERRKHALGSAEHEAFVPQSYDWGVVAQVDWYEGYVDLDGEHVRRSRLFSKRMNLFSSISRASSGVCAKIAFRAWRRRSFAASNASRRLGTSPSVRIGTSGRVLASGEGHEKGGVEGEVGYLRRNPWVLVPAAADLAALNRYQTHAPYAMCVTVYQTVPNCL